MILFVRTTILIILLSSYSEYINYEKQLTLQNP